MSVKDITCSNMSRAHLCALAVNWLNSPYEITLAETEAALTALAKEGRITAFQRLKDDYNLYYLNPDQIKAEGKRALKRQR